MLDLSNTQAKFIKVFIENYRDDSGNILQGISQKGVKKYGLEPKTFGNHKDYFLTNYFLRPITFEQHGPRNDLYYQITRLGVLAYLKWQSKSSYSDVWIDRDFFPEVFKYWEKLVESYEQIFFYVLRKTLERIEIRPHFEGVIHGEIISGGGLDESIRIPTGMLDITIFREYKQPEKQQLPTTKNWGKSITFQSMNKEIDDKITQRFTFLLFFNLLHVGTNKEEFLNLYMQNCIEYDENNTTIQSREEKNSIFTDFRDRILKNVAELYEIINQDETLCPLMKSSISEITDKLANRKSIQTIYDKLA